MKKSIEHLVWTRAAFLVDWHELWSQTWFSYFPIEYNRQGLIRGTRTRTNANPNGTEANVSGRRAKLSNGHILGFRSVAVTATRAAGTSFSSPPKAFASRATLVFTFFWFIFFARAANLFWPAPVVPYEAPALLATGHTPEPLNSPLSMIRDISSFPCRLK
jgi:hypothetical protein